MIRYGDNETKEDLEERTLYRRVFSTRDGKKVLAMILADLGLFEMSEVDNQGQAALQVYAVRLMEHIGCFHEDNLMEITEALLSVRPYTPKEEEAENRAGTE